MTQTPPDNNVLDVLVVGAGPVGLLLANELQLYGCKFRIIDKNDVGSIHSKAMGFVARTLETFDNRNLVEPFLARGSIPKRAVMYNGDKKLAEFTTFGADSPYPYILFVSQKYTEQFLEESLRKASGSDVTIVERSTTLVKYTEDELEDVVVATVTRPTPDGGMEEEIVKAKYIVGCDGVHSAVRKGRSDWAFEGKAYKSEWVLADVDIPAGTLTTDELQVFLHPDGPCGFLPFEDRGGQFRIIANLGDFGYDKSARVTHGIQDERHQHVAPVQRKELTLEDVQALVDRRIAPAKVSISNPSWITTFRINERMVNGLRRGRTFVAGDAAHCHSPIGGQGLNTGVQDAHNLGWKLAFVVQGKVRDAELLLDSYNAEREPIGNNVVNATSYLTRIISQQTYFVYLARLYIIPHFFRSERFQKEVRAMGMGTNIGYRDSPLNHPTPSILRQKRRRQSWLGWFLSLFLGKPSCLIEPGEHLHDGTLKMPRFRPGHATLMLYDVIRGTTTHTLFLFSGGNGVTQESNALVGKVLDVSRRYRKTITPVVISFVNGISQGDFDDAENYVEKTFVETHPVLHNLFGVKMGSQAVLLVRPDLYITFSATAEEVEGGELDKFLGGYLVEDANI
ncbi:FAD binding domain-containing protein [Jimgerdemannia flammicorona]|uniref:FAD binding domain-containing protein n=1 Tax=Jimgerdemannia flammicorona TaxID=994334 RepID=A0A433D5R6_9FUNG|nr:FAD binding domain-containing protein [Jimgerdemannia flammicorona]